MVIREWRKEFEESERARIMKQAVKEGRPVRQAELNAVSHRALTEAEKQKRDRKVATALKEVRAVYGDRTVLGVEDAAPEEVVRPVKRRKRDNDLVILDGKENIIPNDASSGPSERRSTRTRTCS